MTSQLLAWSQRLCVLVGFAVTTAHADKLSLCTARADGNYYAAGEAIRARIDSERLHVQLVETAGSVDNLNRLARAECDAAIVQLDAYLVYQETNRSKRLQLARPNFLYEEFVHLVCRRDAGIDSIEDLAAAQAKNSILIGEAQSGSAATWRSFTLLDPSYASVPTRTVGGMQALTEIKASGGPACMVFVSGLRSIFSAAVNAAGETLKIVPVNDSSLDAARFAGERIYRFRDIPAGTYPALEAGSKGRDLETLTVGAALFVTQSWAAKHNASHSYLVDAILMAKPAVLERVAPK